MDTSRSGAGFRELRVCTLALRFALRATLGLLLGAGAALADLNGDGASDAVFANDQEANRVCLGDGVGGFLSCRDIDPIVDPSHDVALGDLNNDARLDAVFANNGEPNRWCPGDGSGGFPRCLNVSEEAFSSRDVALGDVDGDSQLDIVFANFGQANRMCLNRGPAGFSCSDLGPDELKTTAVVLVDLDRDADLDAVFATRKGPDRVCLNTAGVFGCSDVGGEADSTDVVAGDVNGDGPVDLVFANFQQPNLVCLGDGAGGFACSPVNAELWQSAGLALGDLDGDAHLDLVVANRFNANRVCLNDGSGRFGCQPIGVSAHYSVDVALTDLDRDSDLDIVFADYRGLDAETNTDFPGHNRVCINGGGGRFSCDQVGTDGRKSFGLALASPARAAAQAPVALCRDVTVAADSRCLALASIDGGSHAPDGEAITQIHDPEGPYSAGDTLVSLLVTSASGDFDQCSATVTVVDITPPATPQCNAPASLVRRDVPVSFTATATDNCADIAGLDVEIVDHRCVRFERSGERKDRTGACLVRTEGASIVIGRPAGGGAANEISWLVRATDAAGNSSRASCRVLITNPDKAPDKDRQRNKGKGSDRDDKSPDESKTRKEDKARDKGRDREGPGHHEQR